MLNYQRVHPNHPFIDDGKQFFHYKPSIWGYFFMECPKWKQQKCSLKMLGLSLPKKPLPWSLYSVESGERWFSLLKSYWYGKPWFSGQSHSWCEAEIMGDRPSKDNCVILCLFAKSCTTPVVWEFLMSDGWISQEPSNLDGFQKGFFVLKWHQATITVSRITNSKGSPKRCFALMDSQRASRGIQAS